MKIITARNVNDALRQGIGLMKEEGEKIPSRNGDTLEIPCPVSTIYTRPWEKVLISKIRDANPFFHLMESMWILAGRDDVKFLNEFNRRMVDYSDDGVIFNAPYGYRLRKQFTDHGNCNVDQLSAVITILRKDPNSRQAICQIWDTQDIEKQTKDKACNMSIVFRIRGGKLCMTVYNRSNDMVWGAYGANVVQFSIIQEHVAAHLNIPMGDYTQVSNSYHVYTTGVGGKLWDKLSTRYFDIGYQYPSQLITLNHHDISSFDLDLKMFFAIYDQCGLSELMAISRWSSSYFVNLVLPVLAVYLQHKKYGPEKALKYISMIQGEDWRLASQQWLENRIANLENK